MVHTITSYLESEHLSKSEVKDIILTAAIANSQEPTYDRLEAIGDCLELFRDILDHVE